MFLRSDQGEVAAFLSETEAAEAKKKADLTSRQTYLHRRLQSQEANLKDLMAAYTQAGTGQAAHVMQCTPGYCQFRSPEGIIDHRCRHRHHLKFLLVAKKSTSRHRRTTSHSPRSLLSSPP